jgi:hypothetical protein
MSNVDDRVPRKAWYKPPKNSHAHPQEGTHNEPRWLTEWRDEPAYVLLGDPGAGKTESLEVEAKAANGVFVSADLIQAGVAPSVGEDALVFIDAIDEVKGSGQGAIVGAVARYLRDNGKPRFRIACREADWRVDADRQLLEAVAPGGQVKELHLSPLSDEDIRAVLNARTTVVPDAERFIEQAKQQGVQDWLRNPLLLNLMVESVAQNGQLPDSRKGIYEAACHAMAQEHNDRHLEQQALTAGLVQHVLEDVGTLCALLLLSGQVAISKSARPAEEVMALPALPNDLVMHNPTQAIKSKLFSTEGDLIRPRHRTIAEFLGAKALAKRVQEGLPLLRVLALVQGYDGVPVESMRGLCAWLAVHLHGDQRRLLIEADPLGFIVNGDTAELTHGERWQLIHALAELSEQNPWFRNGQWESHPFGPLASPDMREAFAQALAGPDRSESHQRFIDCLLGALQHAPQPMPALAPLLAQWVMDTQVQEYVRVSAYYAWRRHVASEEQGAQIKLWLDALEGQRSLLKSLVEALLQDAYPQWIQADVLRFLPTDEEGMSIWWFWSREFLRLTPSDLLPSLARAWLEGSSRGSLTGYDFDRREVASSLLCAVLEKHGDGATHQDVYEWLAIGLDEYGFVDQREKNAGVVRWLQSRPDTIKAVAKLCWEHADVDEQGAKVFSSALQRLRGVALPNDWVRWQMSVALNTTGPDLVQYLIQGVNFFVEDKPVGFDVPTVQEVIAWVQVLGAKHPDAVLWFEKAQATASHVLVERQQQDTEQAQRRLRYEAERDHRRQKRLKEIRPHLDRWPETPLPTGLLSAIADAHEKRFSDIQGDTPEARVAEFLGTTSEQELEKVFGALDACLERDDVPEVQKIIDIASKNQRFYLQMPCLLAARRACERDPQAWRSWSTSLQQQLFAFWLTHNFGEAPPWFVSLGAEFPDVVAPVLILFAKSKFKHKSFQSLVGLRRLSQEPTWQALTKRVLSDILDMFPLKAGEDGNRVLNHDLLSALHLLPSEDAKALVEKKLTYKSLDGSQRIAWLVAWLRSEPARALKELVKHVGNVHAQHRRVVIAAIALRQQGVLLQSVSSLPVACVQRLIEWVAPMTSSGEWPGGIVSEEEERADLVRALLGNLGNNPSPEAANALQTLECDSKLEGWEQRAQFHLQQQRRLQRETAFQPASLQAVARVLCRQGPANQADLLALVVDHLKGLESELRGDTTFQLRHFWNGDTRTEKAQKANRDKVPSIENECTLELLALLRPRLQALGLVLEVESQAAAQKRMDLRANCVVDGERITLPIEAKREDHKEVWTAWRDQLQRLYTIDPAAQGRGIYLVYWFGRSPKFAPPVDSKQRSVKPQSAKDMQAMLADRIPAKDRHFIKVVVLDLSWPGD